MALVLVLYSCLLNGCFCFYFVKKGKLDTWREGEISGNMSSICPFSTIISFSNSNQCCKLSKCVFIYVTIMLKCPLCRNTHTYVYTHTLTLTHSSFPPSSRTSAMAGIPITKTTKRILEHIHFNQILCDMESLQ